MPEEIDDEGTGEPFDEAAELAPDPGERSHRREKRVQDLGTHGVRLGMALSRRKSICLQRLCEEI